MYGVCDSTCDNVTTICASDADCATCTGSGISITGNKVTLSNCALSGTVTFSRTWNSGTSVSVTVNGTVSLCGTSYTINKTVSVNASS